MAAVLAVGQQSAPPSADIKSRMDQGVAAFRAHDYQKALAIFKEIIAADPNNILAYNLAGNCSMESGDFPAAIADFQHALQLQPDQPQNLAGLVRSYAQAGMLKERDATLQHLRELSKAGSLPHNFSYVFDSFAAGDRHVLVTEFPQPSGTYRYRYTFAVYDATGNLALRVALESDEFDQPLWAQSHPKEAAAGGRMYSLDGYQQSSSQRMHMTYKFYQDGNEPSYEQVLADVKSVLAGETKPSTTGTMPIQPQPSAPSKPPQ